MKTYKSGSEKTLQGQDFPGGPVVKKVPCHAGNAGSIPGQRTLIPHVPQLMKSTHPIAPMACSKTSEPSEKPPAVTGEYLPRPRPAHDGHKSYLWD